MATNYPGSLDNFTNPTSASPINSPSHADQHANANDAIEAIEGELGVNPKGAKATVKARLDDVDTAIATKAPIASPTFTGIVTLPLTIAGYVKTTSSGVISSSAAIPQADITNLTTDLSNKVSKSGGDTITAVTASTKGLIIQGAASQTANLQEWKNSSGAVLAYIGPSGTNYLGSVVTVGNDIRATYGIHGGGLNTSFSAMGTQSWVSSMVGFLVKGAASQTANLQEWQNSAGTVLANIDAKGSFNLSAQSPTTNLISISQNSLTKFEINQYGQSWNSTKSTFGQYYNTDTGTLPQVSIITGAADVKGLIIRGRASQTANLQEWQNSNGAVSGYVSPDGVFWISTANLLNYGPAIVAGNIASLVQLKVIAAPSQTANLQEWQNSAGTVLAKINQVGSGVFGNATLNAIGHLNAFASAANNVPIVIQGAASQTANLQEWQNSAGTTLANISSAGKLITKNDSEPATSLISTSQNVNGLASVNTSSTSNDYALTLNATNGGNFSNVGMAFSVFGGGGFNGVYPPGAAIWFTRTGGYSLGYLSFLTRTSSTPTDPLSERMRIGESGTVTVNGFTNSSVGLIVKGAASQSANLQEWQNSSGTVLSRIDSVGSAYFSNSLGSTLTSALTLDNPAYGTGTGTQIVFRYGGQNYALISSIYSGTPQGPDMIFSLGSAGVSPSARMRIDNNGTVTINGFVAGAQGLIIKAAASQTADLQQWQNSAGTVLSKFDSGGSLYVNTQLYVNGGGGQGASILSIAGAASVSPIIARGAASQTADLQQWQNSSGTVLNAINKDGYFIGGQFDINGNLSNINYITATRFIGAGNPYGQAFSDEVSLGLYGRTNKTTDFIQIKDVGGGSGKTLFAITSSGAIKGGNSSTISANTATTVDTVALSSFTTMEYTLSIKQGSKIRSSKVLVHTDGTSVDSTEYGIIEMGGGISGVAISASVSSTNAILQVTITDAATTNATVKLIKTML